MLLEITVRQSAIGGLMFRGKMRLKGEAAGGHQFHMEYLGYDRAKDEEVYGLVAVAGKPSENDTLEADFDFDFYHHTQWVREVRIMIHEDLDTLVLVEHLGREG